MPEGFGGPSEGAYWEFHTKESVERLLNSLCIRSVTDVQERSPDLAAAPRSG
jgi:hypothetical protein